VFVEVLLLRVQLALQHFLQVTLDCLAAAVLDFEGRMIQPALGIHMGRTI